jgi:hypothetical protein
MSPLHIGMNVASAAIQDFGSPPMLVWRTPTVGHVVRVGA